MRRRSWSSRPTRITVRSTCDTCGDVDLHAHGISLVLAWAGVPDTYTFRCSTCQRINVRRASLSAQQQLLEAKVRVVQLACPEELRETHDGPPIGHDDLIEFHQALASLPIVDGSDLSGPPPADLI
jgi:hypothetical protein